MHNKYMIIDNQILYTGSYNWAFNAEFNTFEKVAVIDDKKVIGQYQQNFIELLGYGGQISFFKFIKNLENENVRISLFFPAKIMTINQIDQIKKVVESKCPSLYLGPVALGSCKVQ